ncbi:hypothetical protein BGZ65_013040, partial [Modicella reniformis]
RGKDQAGTDWCAGVVTGGTSRGGPDEGRGDANGRDGRHNAGHTSHAGKEEAGHDAGQIPDLDPEFLAALPPDIRAELESAHRLEVMKNRQRQADLAAEAKTRQAAAAGSYYAGRSIRESGPPPPERPTLMGMRETSELRVMLVEWVQSTLIKEEETAANDMQCTDASIRPCVVFYDEGPNPDDVQSFSNFIVRVIYMERDLDRVRLLLRCLKRKVEENERQASPAHSNPKHVRVLMSWQEALERIMDVAQRLVFKLYGGS